MQLEDDGKNAKVYNSAYAKCGNTKEEKHLEQWIAKYLQAKMAFGTDLVIKCHILHYDEGNRFARYMVGFGAGAASATIKVELETKSGKKLGSFETAANMSMGVFGGSALETLESSAQIIVDFVGKNYIENFIETKY